jgi:hypothetical protein
MLELKNSIASLDKRQQALFTANDTAAAEGRKAKAEAGTDKAKLDEADKRIAQTSDRAKKIWALKERLEALNRNAATVKEDPTSDSGVGAYKDEAVKIDYTLSDLESELSSEGMMGAKGPRFFSKTMWTGSDGYERIDAENPDPGGRPGQIHYQPDPKHKWYYNPAKNEFYDENTRKPAPKSVQDKLNDPEIKSAIDEAMRQLSGKPKP